MKLVVGLGNPGRRYASTRHNAGFRVVARFADRFGIELDSRRFDGLFGRGRVAADARVAQDVGVLMPLTFMNRSGESVAAALAEFPVGDPASDLLVVLDDVDLPFGRLRIRPSGGSGGHRGLDSVIAHVARSDFPRLRFGIDRPPTDVDTVEYVLQPFSFSETDRLDASIDSAVQAVESVLLDGVVPAMNQFNREAP